MTPVTIGFATPQNKSKTFEQKSFQCFNVARHVTRFGPIAS